MSRKLSFSMDDESGDLVQRYEQFLSGKANGYFDVEELENIVEYYLRRGRTKDCNTAIDLGLQLHPNNSILKTKRAKIYLITGDEQKAYRLLESLAESTDYEVLLLKIEVLIKLKQILEAKLLSEKMLADESEDLDNVCLDVAYLFLAHSEYKIALDLLERGYKSNPQNPDLLYELAFCYEQNENLTKAIAVNLQIIETDPFANEAWFNLGQMYFAQLDFPKALEAYDYALAIDDKDTLTCLQKAHVHFQLNQFDEAIETYLEYRSLSNFVNWQTDIYIAECYEKLEKYDQAIVYYKQSLDEQEDNYDALTGIAICLLEQELYAESIPYVEKALKISPEAADAWVYLAEAYVGLDDLDNALLAYVKSISIDAEQPDTLMAIANICMEKAEFELALKYYLAARDQSDSTEYIDLFIAVSYCKLGDLINSAIYLKIAVQRDDNSTNMFLELCPEAENLILFS